MDMVLTQGAVAAGLSLLDDEDPAIIRHHAEEQSGQPMEKRQHSRINSSNLLSYTCVNAENTVVQQGMGKTLDVSEGGILLETHVPIDSQHLVYLDIGFKDDVAELIGKVAYTRNGESGRVESGIRFEEYGDETRQVLQQFIEEFKGV